MKRAHGASLAALWVIASSACGFVEPTCDLVSEGASARIEFSPAIPLPYRAEIETGPGRFDVVREIDSWGNETAGLALADAADRVDTFAIDCIDIGVTSCSQLHIDLPDLPKTVSVRILTDPNGEAEIAIDARNVAVEYVIERHDGREGCPPNKVRGKAQIR